jgi:hypothetical protein
MFMLLFQLILLVSIQAFADDGQKAREPKVLVLIIASDGLEAYKELQNIWKSYMDSDPEHFEAYFIRGNPQLVPACEIEGQNLTVKSIESYVPGILHKTVLSMEAMMPRLSEFDFVLRTNLSSFYVLPRLLDFVKKLPKKRCYCGVQLHLNDIPNFGRVNFISGAGILLSTDLVELLVKEKESLFAIENELPDDMLLGVFFQRHAAHSIPAERTDFPSVASWLEHKDRIAETDFHFRAKSNYLLRSPQESFADELFINRQLLYMFYPYAVSE